MPDGEEGLFRAFIFALPFFVLLSVFLLKDKPRLLSIFIIFTLIVGIAALYGPGSYRVATETELQGTSYCALKIPDKNVPYLPTNNVLLYQFEPFVRYHNPLTGLRFEVFGHPPFVTYNSTSIAEALNSANYIVVSRDQKNYYSYLLGFDPFENTNLAGNLSLIHARLYDNGNFTVYGTTKP